MAARAGRCGAAAGRRTCLRAQFGRAAAGRPLARPTRPARRGGGGGTAAHRPPGAAVAALGPLLDAVGGAYLSALAAHPRVVQAVGSSAIYALGDVIAQRAWVNGWDKERTARFGLTGLGAGVLWGAWYDAADAALADVHSNAVRLSLSLLLEQFLWCPIFYGLFLLPFTSALAGKSRAEVGDTVKQELVPTLVANAKVWTPANIVIYSAPVMMRVAVSNIVDVLWAIYLSVIAVKVAGETGGGESAPSKEVKRDVPALEKVKVGDYS